jgi:hypothetical protein
MRIRRRQCRVLAAAVLGYWLLALFISIAHACGLGEKVGYSEQIVTITTAGQGHTDDGAPPACKRFCADDSAVLPKVKSGQDQPGGDALLVPPPLGEPLLARAASAASLRDRPQLPPAIALNTRFVRLAL